ncbi:hypothetical protein CsatB_029782 [Cannabis sativa]
MGVPSDDVVLIHQGKNPGEPYIVTVNCPDKTGLGCDICRIILDFGLYISKGDISTDGIWCYIVLWVVPHSSSVKVKWSNLKNRLQSECPSCLPTFYFNQPSTSSLPSPVDLLHTKDRQDETLEQLHVVLGESCITCELQLVGPEYERHQGISSLSPVVAEELFRCELSDREIHSQALSPDMTKLKNANVTVDNSLSLAHTLLQIHCADHKGLLYDIMRTLKDCNIQQIGGKKILDLEKLDALCSRLKAEMLHPLRVIIASRGPDTELLVANPVELSGSGRPQVFYDVTLALKSLGICIFSVRKTRANQTNIFWELPSST